MQVRFTVKPNSKKGPLVEEVDGALVVYVREPAVEGRANAAVIELLAKHYGVAKTRVTIEKGQGARFKTTVIS